MHDSAAPGFGAALRRLRGIAGLTQEALADRARISVEAVSALERGFRKRPHSDTVALLAKALGLSDAQQMELEAATLSGKDAREQEHVWPEVGRPSAARDNLPHSAVPLVGRDGEIEAITKALRRSPLLTLTGAGGIGKTRVALQVGANMRGISRDGVWFVDVSSLSESDLIPVTIASALGLRLPSAGDILAALLSALRTKRLLLLLDNCEHLLDTLASVVVALLRSCPGIGILATSRQRLGVAGEKTYRMPSLAVPEADDAANLHADQAPAFGAIALFVTRAEETGTGFTLTDANAPLIADICRRLDGIALAIELAAAQVRILSLPELRDRLDARFQLLVGGIRGAVPRHQTLRATFDWSYELLEEHERVFFRTLGVFVDGFTLEAARAVCGDGTLGELQMLELLAGLVDKSFILADVQNEVTRYRMLETVRAYALEQMSQSGERDRLAGRHLAYFREYVEHAASAFEATGSSTTFVAALAIEAENIRAAMRWSLSGGDVVAGATVAAAIGRLEAFLVALPDVDAALRARIWTALAVLFGITLRISPTCEAAEQAVACARVAGDPAILFNALRTFAVYMARHERFAEAETALCEAEFLAGSNPPPLQHLNLMSTQGHVASYRGDYVRAVRAYDAVRPLFRAAGDVLGEANATLHIAELEHARGDTARAIDLVREILPKAECVLGRELHANLLSNLAGYLVAANDLFGARAAGSEVIALVSPANPTGLFVLFALENVALALALEGECERAARLLGYCVARQKDEEFERQFTEQTTRDRLTVVLGRHVPQAMLEALMVDGADFAPQRAIEEALGTNAPV